MNILDIAQSRYTSKAYGTEQTISPQSLDRILEVLRLSPSSINIQPWKFLVAQSQDAKEKIAHAMPDNFAYNIPKVMNSSAVIIFTARTKIDDQHLEKILEAEETAGRFRTPESKTAQYDARVGYVHINKNRDLERWVDNQIHIALGFGLVAARAEQLCATPIGGFNSTRLDSVLNLHEQDLRSVVLLALGTFGEQDFNASLPKARLSKQQVIQVI